MKRLALCLAGVMGLLVSGCAVDQSQTAYGVATDFNPDLAAATHALADDLAEVTLQGEDLPEAVTCTIHDYKVRHRDVKTIRGAGGVHLRRYNAICPEFTVTGTSRRGGLERSQPLQ